MGEIRFPSIFCTTPNSQKVQLSLPLEVDPRTFLYFYGGYKQVSTHYFMNRQFIIFFLLITSYCQGQDSLLIDPRDGKVYPLVTLGHLQWFKTNLAYETLLSWCAEHRKKDNCNDGNFYYYNDIDSVCPVGWRVPTWTDWETTMKFIMLLHKQNPDSLIHNESGLNRYSVTVTGTHFLEDTLALDMKPFGWIQGEKHRKSNGQANYFIIDDVHHDPTTHVHVGPEMFIKHAHDFNIIDKRKYQRRLSIRCVKNIP